MLDVFRAKQELYILYFQGIQQLLGEKQQNFSTNKKSIEFFEIHGKQWEIENVNLEQSQAIQVQILFEKSIEYLKVNMHGKQL